MSKARYTVADFEPHIAKSGGIISTIASRVGCEWSTARRHIDESPTLTRMYNDECESVLDLAESVLIKSIQGGDTQDAKWLLTKKGKGRGYGDVVTNEISGPDGGAIPVELVDYRAAIAETEE
jgi:hypothetical protein